MSPEGRPQDLIFLVDWGEEAGLAGRLRGGGWRVEVESADGGEAYRRIRESRPRAVVLAASRPSHGAEVARSLRNTRALRDLPILCVDADEAARERISRKSAGVRFVTSGELQATLEEVTRPGAAETKF